MLTGAFIVIVLAALTGWFAWKAGRAEQRAARLLHQAEVARLVATADRIQDADYDASLLINLEAVRAAPTLDAEAGLLRRFVSHPYVSAFLAGHGDTVHGVAFSPDGKLLASGSWDNTIVLWDVDRRRLLTRLKGHKKKVFSVAFSPDGKRLASGSQDQTILLWDVDSHKPLATLQGTSLIRSLAFSPDGRLLASGSGDHTVIVWDTETRKPLYNLKGHQADVNRVAFSQTENGWLRRVMTGP